MWYAPGMGKGVAEPYIGTICYLSTLTWGRMKQMDLKKESEIPALQLQHHVLVTACQIVQINLLLLDVAFKPPEINFPRGFCVGLSFCCIINSGTDSLIQNMF